MTDDKTIIRAAVLGASGYTGAELIRLLLLHGGVQLSVLTGDSQAGKSVASIYPHLASAGLPDLIKIGEVEWSDLNVVFCCLPHGTTQEVVAGIPDTVKVIDLSADFRLADTATYAQWYGHEHYCPQLQKEAVYGLSEHARDKIRNARLVANPGCYPTAAQLPLLPLISAGLIRPDEIIIDAKSGITGAGRAAKQNLLYTEREGGINPYGVGKHRHAPEIEQGLSFAAGEDVRIRFTPHLVPMSRGILATIYLTLSPGVEAQIVHKHLVENYCAEAFVHVLPFAEVPSTHHVRGTNHCHIGVSPDCLPGKLVITSVIDNLVKGAAGQALQNFNLMFGFDEGRGLAATAIFP